MLTIRIINDKTGTDDAANYNYYVAVNLTEIATGHVEGHDRKDGWAGLLKMIAAAGGNDEHNMAIGS